MNSSASRSRQSGFRVKFDGVSNRYYVEEGRRHEILEVTPMPGHFDAHGDFLVAVVEQKKGRSPVIKRS